VQMPENADALFSAWLTAGMVRSGAADPPRVCEEPCRTDDDCDYLSTACVAGSCALVACGGGSGNGMDNSTCSIRGQPRTEPVRSGLSTVAWFAYVRDREPPMAAASPTTSLVQRILDLYSRDTCLGDPLGDGAGASSSATTWQFSVPTGRRANCSNQILYRNVLPNE